jgi:hypothetical protein
MTEPAMILSGYCQIPQFHGTPLRCRMVRRTILFLLYFPETLLLAARRGAGVWAEA